MDTKIDEQLTWAKRFQLFSLTKRHYSRDPCNLFIYFIYPHVCIFCSYLVLYMYIYIYLLYKIKLLFIWPINYDYFSSIANFETFLEALIYLSIFIGLTCFVLLAPLQGP